MSGVLLDLARARHVGPRPEWRLTVPPNEWLETRGRLIATRTCWAGSTSVTTGGRFGHRYVAEGQTMTVVAGEEFPNMWPGELRRDYMKACDPAMFDHPRRRPLWGGRDEDGLEEIKGLIIPGLVRPHPELPLVGVDLTNCYLSLLRHFSTRVEYRPSSGAWAPVGEEWLDLEELRNLKTLYATIVSRSWMAKHSFRYCRGTLVQSPGTLDTYQPQAARLLSDYLHAVMQECVALFDAYALCADEVVVREELAEDVREFLRGRWGLESRVKRRWEPGQEWPWSTLKHARARIRELSPQVRNALAWRLAGESYHGAAFVALSAHVLEPAPEPPEPAPLPWHLRAGMRPWGLLELAPIPAPREHAPRKGSPRRVPPTRTAVTRGRIEGGAVGPSRAPPRPPAEVALGHLRSCRQHLEASRGRMAGA